MKPGPGMRVARVMVGNFGLGRVPMVFALQSAAVVVEIRRGPAGDIPAALISAAYRASRTKPIVLVLDSISPTEVDEVLDPLVPGTHRDYQGVRYAKADDSEELAEAAKASVIFAESPQFTHKLLSLGIPYEDIAKAVPVLRAAS